MVESEEQLDQIMESLQDRIRSLQTAEATLRTKLTLPGSHYDETLQTPSDAESDASEEDLSYHLSSGLSSAAESDATGYRDFLNSKGEAVDYSFEAATAIDAWDDRPSEEDLKFSDHSDPFEPTITVPKPFSFIARDKNKPRKALPPSREEREREFVPVRFRAKPIPETSRDRTLYAKLVNAQAIRREENKQNSKLKLMKTQRPFSFFFEASHHKKPSPPSEAEDDDRENTAFTANSVPASTFNNTFQKIQEKDQTLRARRDKQRKEIEERRMAWVEREKMKREAKLQDTETGFRKPPVNPVPDFKKLQLAFEQKMRQRKQSRPTTRVQEFKFTRVAKKQKKRSAAGEAEADESAAHSRRAQRCFKPVPTAYKPKSTLKFDQAKKLREERRRERERRALEERRKLEQSRRREVAWGKKLKKFLRHTNDQALARKRERDLAEAKEQARQMAREYREDKKRMMERVAARPLLIEGSSKSTKDAKTREVLQKIRDTMEKSGLQVSNFFDEAELSLTQR